MERGECVLTQGGAATAPPHPSWAAHVTPLLSLLSLPVGVGMKLTDVGIATLAKG